NQDPVLSKVKLIAEPWDVGEGGYQVGRFPSLWAEWNGKYRDVVRRYWKGDDGQLAELGYRLTGSSDLYQGDGRRPSASINFVIAHDGFTLTDLVSYNDKHNEANGEDNRDGTNENYSWNCGVEGPTDDEKVIELRERQKRNMLATLLLSQGVPMICAGDEIGRTQFGNNNAYCQDNEISWVDWNLDDRKRSLLAFATNLIALRREHANFHRRKFFQDRKISPSSVRLHSVDGVQVQDITWYRPDGKEMTEDEWHAGWVRCLGLYLSGQTLDDVDRYGEQIQDDSFLFCLNPHHDHIEFYMPKCSPNSEWELVFDTRYPLQPEQIHLESGKCYDLMEHSAALFREVVRKITPREEQQGKGEELPAVSRLQKNGAVNGKPAAVELQSVPSPS
ncbi:MAG TPA: hypothetical protein VGE93_23515, partial [Bryobacteraceae bacterium]